eukprot:2495908-Rhodomonas_salina.1
MTLRMGRGKGAQSQDTIPDSQPDREEERMDEEGGGQEEANHERKRDQIPAEQEANNLPVEPLQVRLVDVP